MLTCFLTVFSEMRSFQAISLFCEAVGDHLENLQFPCGQTLWLLHFFDEQAGVGW